MQLERLTLTNFQCFGPDSTTIRFDPQLTALLGANASGKTAACQALLRLFSVVAEQRQIRVEDFHVPDDEDAQNPPDQRELTIEAVFAFPELRSDDDAAAGAVPEFFAQMSADEDGQLKLRIVLGATWSAKGPVTGTIEESRRVVHTFQTDYDENWVELRASDRNRIQMVYVPATRDGARQVDRFLRGRIWRAGQWSEPFRQHVSDAADELTGKFKGEPVVDVVTGAISSRWQQLHQAVIDQKPSFKPIDRDVSVLVTSAELIFEPSPAGRTRPASELSDGQQSLLYIALTAATLDLEAAIAAGHHIDSFDLLETTLPSLTLLALEEPENNLAPYFLSCVIQQVLDVTAGGRAQALISSHSASAIARIDPEKIRHLRLDVKTKTARVNEILLPDDGTEAGKYLREAVRAHPELYFARFVVLGEGASEELVIPKLAAARDVHIDQSFVAMVPLGGRHTNHFWRLLAQIDVPHATLLDLDWGRAGGGEGRIRDACDRLISIDRDPFEGIEGYTCTADIENLDRKQLVAWMSHLETFNVFFSAPLDLDMALLKTFKSAYTTNLEPGAKGPGAASDPRDAVLGDATVRPHVAYWADDAQLDDLRWYRYLFLTHSKPGTHLRALNQLSKSELGQPPARLGRLLDLIAKAVDSA